MALICWNGNKLNFYLHHSLKFRRALWPIFAASIQYSFISSYSRTLDSHGLVLGFIQARAETQNISVRLDSQSHTIIQFTCQCQRTVILPNLQTMHFTENLEFMLFFIKCLIWVAVKTTTILIKKVIEPRREKYCIQGLYNHRRWLEI